MKGTKEPITWLPVDSRLLSFLSFGRVKGITRLFLIIEMVLATLVVMGTTVLVVLTAFR